MKGTSLIVTIVLFIEVVILYILHFAGGKTTEFLSSEPAVSERPEGLRIAYLKSDSLILNYDLSEVLHDEFMKKQEAYNQEYGTKRQSFEREAAEFQQKLQRGGFLTEQRAIQERDRLLGREQEIMKLDQDLSTRLAEMQDANNKQIIDSLLNYLKIFNETRNYDFILNAAGVLIGPESDNITAEVLQAMNARYQALQTKK